MRRNIKFLHLKTLSTFLNPNFNFKPPPSTSTFIPHPFLSSTILPESSRTSTLSPCCSATLLASRTFCSSPSHRLSEDEFHNLANSTIHDLLEKLEEYGDSVDIDGLDIDYGNEVLTLKLGALGTYVVNKQTPNRQIWLSSPVSGPSRYDWDPDAQAWIYRRKNTNLFKLLENELEKLCGKPLNLL